MRSTTLRSSSALSDRSCSSRFSALRIRALAFGDIDDRTEHEIAFRGAQRIEADLHRHLAAIFPQGMEFAAATHGADRRIAIELRAKPRVSIPESLRDQHLDLLAQ